jgi:hypothetical protein
VLLRKFRAHLPVKWQEEAAVQTLGGPLLKGFHPVVPDNGYTNFLAAFRKRCNYYDAGIASRLVRESSIKLINRLVPDTMPQFDWTEVRYRDWLSQFQPEKQNRMENALRTFAFARTGDYSGKEVFVKVEALLATHKPNWAPRVIYKGSDLYNAISGPMFKELMNRLDLSFQGMKGDRKFRVAYKCQPHEYIPLLVKQQGEFIESDFSANDMRQCQDVMRLELMLMRRLGCPEWFVRLHAFTNQFKVKSREHRLSAELVNQLPTGVTDTTFRNSFWNACILSAFLDKTRAKSCSALLLGDDMLARILGLPRYAAKIYESVARSARMSAEVKRHKQIADCGFLSKVFVPRQYECPVVMPLPGKALARFNVRANRNAAVSNSAYFAAKAIGYAYEFRYVPEIRDIFLDRFTTEASIANEEKHRLKFMDQIDKDDLLSWSARTAGVTLRNIRDKLVVPDEFQAQSWDLAAFVEHRYGMTRSTFVTIFEDVILSQEPGDYDHALLPMLVRDFI